MNNHLRPIAVWTLALAVIAVCSFAVAADKSVKSLQSVVNGAGYSLINPARNDVVPGGFIVANTRHATYNSLPTGVSFSASPFSASVYSSTSSGSFSLAALVSGIAKTLGGGVEVSRDSQLTVKQIDASAQKIDPDAVIANSTIQSKVKEWLSDKKAGYQVYLIDVTLSATDISITSNSETDVAAAFPQKPANCPATSTASSTNSSGAAPSTTGGSDTTAAPGKTAAKTKGGTTNASGSASTPSTGTSNSSTPSGAVQVCINGKSVVGLSTKTPLVFAASLRRIKLEDDGSLSVSPVTDIANTKAGTHVEPLPAEIDWNPKHAKPGFVGPGK